jgi:DNA-binding transcriptional MerR regulator
VSSTLSIGEFSKLTHLSVKALRHYHEIGLLVPAEVDTDSRYRHYDPTQARDAQLIRRLRALDMPIEMVRAVVTATDDERRSATIAAHLRAMEDELERTRDVVASLRALLDQPLLDIEVERRQLPDMTALAISADVRHDHLERWGGAAFEELGAAVVASRADVAGPGGGLFPAALFEDERGHVTAYVPVSGVQLTIPGDFARVALADIAGGEVLVATHAGPYADLDRTYAVLGAAANDLGIAADGPIRELYIVGPDVSDDPLRYRTEVCWPVVGSYLATSSPTSLP